MEILTEFWGLSLNQTVFLLAAILIVVDFFIPNDVSTHIAYVILCGLLAINIDAHILVKILCALLAWFALIAFHYFFWKTIIQKIVNTIVAPDRFRPGADGLIGSKGIIKIVDGNVMVKVKGDLWPCIDADSIADGTPVEVTSQKNGELKVK